ncbi:MAG: DUF4349 domain-containing protein [Anaerolineales bacterium]
MTKKLIFFTLLMALAISACSPAATPAAEPARDFGAGGASGAPAPAEQEAQYATTTDAAANSAAVERLVIKNANLSLVVKDPTATVESVTALAEGLGGFVVSSNVYQATTDAAGNKIMQAQISIRVPVAQLSTALAQLKGMAVTVNSENVSGEDVTAQYTDLESQLRNLEAAEAQLQKIMDGATKTEDVLNVYNQLVAVRGQIEQVKGQMKYYSESAAMSLIYVDLIPDALSRPIEIGGWRPEGVAKDALEALLRAFQGIATTLIWVGVYLLPLGLVFGIPLYLGARLVRRRRKPKNVAA